MPKFLLFILAIALLGCKGPIRKYRTHNSNDINQVIKAVIIQDSLYLNKLPFNSQLGRLVFNRQWMFSFKIDSLFSESRPTYFDEADYPYISFQRGNDTSFTVDKSTLPKISFTTLAEHKAKNKTTQGQFYFYEMSVPLFSVDQQLAYIQVTLYYMKSQGVGYEYFLRKTNGKWTIVFKEQTWIS
jgi:hypothetical protein